MSKRIKPIKIRIAEKLSKKLFFSLLLLSFMLVVSCMSPSFEGMTLVIVQDPEAGSGRTLLGLINPSKPGGDPLVLVNEFKDLASPDVSYSGRAVLFQARKNAQDPWQIWEYELSSDKLRQISKGDSDCIDPVYLPDGRILYSRFSKEYSGYHALETCDTEGEDIRQVTFGPIDFRSPIVLKDGRVLAVSREVYPEKQKRQLMIMRPDGTKMELFYESPENYVIGRGPFEMEDGRIAFSEMSQSNISEVHWISVSYDSPMSSRQVIQEPEQVKKAQRPESRTLPRKLPSAVNPESETALLLCMDANLTEIPDHGTEKSEKIELLGLQGSLGIVNLEDDGSVYLKIQADMPFRIQTLDGEGEVIQGPSSWLQLRPNERRGCVGCHAGHTRVPENVQPLAVQKEPVEIPLFEEALVASQMLKDTGE